MSKFKPKKALLKRISITANGKVKYHRAGKSHLNSGIPASRLRHLRNAKVAVPGDIRRLERMLGQRLTPGPREQ